MDIPEESPIKNSFLTEDDLKNISATNKSLPSSNTILLQVMDYPTISSTLSANGNPTMPEVVTIDQLVDTSLTEEPIKSVSLTMPATEDKV